VPDAFHSAQDPLLGHGIREVDRTGEEVVYRLLGPGDDLEALTAMLHAAYRPLAEAGMRYVASYQDVAITRRRIANGETIVATRGTDLIATVTWRMPGAKSSTSPHYNRSGVASFGQFAVAPPHQKRGIGSRLLALVEERSRRAGVTELALDTSEGAADLIDFYGVRGYRFIEFIQWDVVNYRSVILSKLL
jgi:GNAT superfamily N-acetyltransferase